MKLAIDANRYTDFCRGVPEAVRPIQLADQLFMPFVVLAELRAGFLMGSASRANEKLLREFLRSARVSILLPDETTTRVYAALFLQLRTAGTPIPTNDLWIASIVIQHDLCLLTRDRHFEQVKQLSIV